MSTRCISATHTSAFSEWKKRATEVGASLKSLFGGELRGMTKMLQESRHEAVARLTEEAEALGANAVLAMRFDNGEFASTANEVCAYGTAVRVRKL